MDVPLSVAIVVALKQKMERFFCKWPNVWKPATRLSISLSLFHTIHFIETKCSNLKEKKKKINTKHLKIYIILYVHLLQWSKAIILLDKNLKRKKKFENKDYDGAYDLILVFINKIFF